MSRGFFWLKNNADIILCPQMIYTEISNLFFNHRKFSESYFFVCPYSTGSNWRLRWAVIRIYEMQLII